MFPRKRQQGLDHGAFLLNDFGLNLVKQLPNYSPKKNSPPMMNERAENLRIIGI